MGKPNRGQTWSHGIKATNKLSIGGHISQRRAEAIEQELQLDASQGVPQLSEKQVDRSRRVVLGSKWMSTLAEGDQVEAGKELFAMLGLRIIDQDPNITTQRVVAPANRMGE
jgi:hypothetical protein